MKKTLLSAGVVCVALALGLAGVALGNSGVKGEEPAMMVSPQTIVLAKVDSVTVHTNILASSVASGSVALNDVAPLSVWADDCGHIAARFSVDALALESDEAVTMTLTGAYDDDETFSAVDIVRVK
jgi:hypothetical protein